jgi:hypothetical protein
LLLSSLSIFGPNLGLPVGYYGELNRTKWRVSSISGVRIEAVRVNYDITVEEFTIDVVIDNVHRASLYIPDVSLPKRLLIVDQWEKVELPRYRAQRATASQ